MVLSQELSLDDQRTVTRAINDTRMTHGNTSPGLEQEVSQRASCVVRQPAWAFVNVSTEARPHPAALSW